MIIGLTGGIGSGKSTVAKLLEMKGCLLFNSDEVAKSCYHEKNTQKKVIALLGKEAYNKHGINKDYISRKIFDNPILLKKLNAIIHPQVKKKFERFVDSNKGKIIIKESALLFEAGIEKDADLVVVVAAPDELRIQRVMKRDATTSKLVELKLKQQMPQKDKIKRAGTVIYNDEKKSLIEQVNNLFSGFPKR